MSHPRPTRRPCAPAALLAATTLAAFTSAASAEGSCTAKSVGKTAPVVELYTSEGCNSCPPADRWLSRLKTDPGVVALAFHVDYWDRLGWKDRFASAAFTARQAAQQTSNGARFSYTPQVVVNGIDETRWPAVSAESLARAVRPAAVDIALTRQGAQVVATVEAAGEAPRRLAAYWAVTEQGHSSNVQAGENRGVVLKHDFVVRDYQPVAAWSVRADAPQTLRFTPTTSADPAHPRQVNLVVVNAENGRPVQALKIDC